MKALFKKALLLCMVIGFCFSARAQLLTGISRNPVNNVTSARSKLFALPAGDSNFYFRINLPGDNFLIMQFNRLSHWPKENISAIVENAKTAWLALQDSFTSTTSSRRLSLHIPAAGYPTIANIAEWGVAERTILLKGINAQPLRLSPDTITILQMLPDRSTDTGNRRQVQYTFLLKDLSEIETIASDTALLNRASQTFDSLVTAKEAQWRKPDAAYHALEAQYNAQGRFMQKEPSLQVATTGSFLLNKFDYSAELGGGFVAGAIATTANLRLSYDYPPSTRIAEKDFVALSVSGLAFVSQENNELVLRRLTFLNLEVGSVFREAATRLPAYRTSAGIGYRIDSHNEGVYNFKYRLYFTYSLSKAITLTPELYLFSKKSFSGLTVSLRFF